MGSNPTLSARTKRPSRKGWPLCSGCFQQDSNGSGSEWSAGGTPEPRPGLLRRAGRILHPPPNKHRDFDTKSRCSSYLQKSRNTNIFKAFRYNVLPGRDYSCRFFCYIMVEQQMCHKLNVRIIGLSCRLWEVTCNLSSYRAPYGAIV